MSRRYDSRTTIFSPEGRLYQVEYAMEAISNAGSALGVLATDGVVLAAEKKITSKVSPPMEFALVDAHESSLLEGIIRLADHLYHVVALINMYY